MPSDWLPLCATYLYEPSYFWGEGFLQLVAYTLYLKKKKQLTAICKKFRNNYLWNTDETWICSHVIDILYAVHNWRKCLELRKSSGNLFVESSFSIHKKQKLWSWWWKSLYKGCDMAAVRSFSEADVTSRRLKSISGDHGIFTRVLVLLKWNTTI